LPVEILVGKKNLEVRPQAINKGEIVKRLMGMIKGVDFVFCAGDDKTDEDMFKALKHISPACNAFTCTVGGSAKKTQAGWHVERSEDIVNVLTELAASF
jgi:trehalose 6-phosphate synthase/phosphatase